MKSGASHLSVSGWPRAVACLLAASSVCACSGVRPVVKAEPSCPGWTRGERPPEYPEKRTLMGLGMVGNVWDPTKGEEAGKAAALADLAKQLRVTVASEIHVASWEKTGAGGGTSVDEATTLKANVALQGARIASRCFDPGSATLYTLAVVELADLARRVLADIQEGNESGHKEMGLARQLAADGKHIEALPHARAALAAASEVSQLGQMVRAVSGEAAPRPFQEPSEVKTYLAELRANTRVRLTLDRSVPEVEGAVFRAVTDSGAHIARDGDGGTAALLLRGRVDDLGAARSSIGAFVARLHAFIEVVRLDTSSVVEIIDRTDSGGGRTQSEAQSRAAAAVAATIGPDVRKALERVLGSDAQPK